VTTLHNIVEKRYLIIIIIICDWLWCDFLFLFYLFIYFLQYLVVQEIADSNILVESSNSAH